MPTAEQLEQIMATLCKSLEDAPEELRADGSTVVIHDPSGTVTICAWGKSAQGVRALLGIPAPGRQPPPSDPSMN